MANKPSATQLTVSSLPAVSSLATSVTTPLVDLTTSGSAASTSAVSTSTSPRNSRPSTAANNNNIGTSTLLGSTSLNNNKRVTTSLLSGTSTAITSLAASSSNSKSTQLPRLNDNFNNMLQAAQAAAKKKEQDEAAAAAITASTTLPVDVNDLTEMDEFLSSTSATEVPLGIHYLNNFIQRMENGNHYKPYVDGFKDARKRHKEAVHALSNLKQKCLSSTNEFLHLPKSMRINIVDQIKLKPVEGHEFLYKTELQEIAAAVKRTEQAIYNQLVLARDKEIKLTESRAQPNNYIVAAMTKFKEEILNPFISTINSSNAESSFSFPTAKALAHFNFYLSQELVAIIMDKAEEKHEASKEKEAQDKANAIAEDTVMSGAGNGDTIQMFTKRAIDQALSPFLREISQLKIQLQEAKTHATSTTTAATTPTRATTTTTHRQGSTAVIHPAPRPSTAHHRNTSAAQHVSHSQDHRSKRPHSDSIAPTAQPHSSQSYHGHKVARQSTSHHTPSSGSATHSSGYHSQSQPSSSSNSKNMQGGYSQGKKQH